MTTIKYLTATFLVVILFCIIFMTTTALLDEYAKHSGYYDDGYRESSELLEKW